MSSQAAQTTGIHHVTAIAGAPQGNLDFYAGLLGLRMVKRTVNFDAPETYHLYYGDRAGSPGTILTFFPWADAPPGVQGSGQLTAISFSAPPGSFGYWTERLVEAGVRFENPHKRLGETILPLTDPDGMRLELVAAEDGREDLPGGLVPDEYAVRGFHHVTLSERNPERTAGLMAETLGFRRVAEEDGRLRFAAGEDGPGNLVDVVDGTEHRRGRMGVGTVHHIAFRVPDEDTQAEMREEVAGLGYDVTPVLDRQYFKSVYFREPGGVLFEIATDPPGFSTDETPEDLGASLKLPPWLEPRRGEIETALPPLRLPKGG